MDNCPVHKSKVTQKFTTEKNLKILFLPAYSPDLNPIENVWSWIKRKLRKKVFDSMDSLKEELENLWNMVDHKKYISNYSQRLELVVKKKGKATKY